MKRLSLALLLCTLTISTTAFADVFTYTPITHATFVLQSERTTFYSDPVDEIAEFASFSPPNLILITHSHKDHITPELITSYNSTALNSCVA